MTTPNIADVKAAAESVAAYYADCEKHGVPLSRFENKSRTIADWAESVLNAPGLSAERLAEIEQRLSKARMDFNSDESPWDLQNEADELLVEVLRLRAGVSGESQPERVMPPAAGTDSIG